MKEKLQKAYQLQTELDTIIQEIKPLLKPYSTSHHYSLDHISDVAIWDDSVSFTASGNCWGYFEEHFQVKLDYFDDPDGYIENENKEKQKEKEEAKKKEHKRQE